MSIVDKSLLKSELATDSPKVNSRTLPTSVLKRILQYLPVPDLATFATVSKEFKILVYNDNLWNVKLQLMLNNDHGTLASLLKGKKQYDTEEIIYLNNKPFTALIPGNISALDKFKYLYSMLFPYYSDLRNETKDNTKLLREFNDKPEQCGKIINLLTGLGQCHIVEDWREINEDLEALSQYFESTSLHQFQLAYDSHNIPEMKIYADALIALNGGSSCIQLFIQKHPSISDIQFKVEENFIVSHDDITPFKQLMENITKELLKLSFVSSKVFPNELDVFYLFVERIFEGIIGESISKLLNRAISFSKHLYLRTIATVLVDIKELVDVLTSDTMPKRIEPNRGINLIFKLFLPFLDDYLFEELNYAETVTKQYIDEWNIRSSVKKIDHPARLTSQTRETFKRNYLNAFKKVLTLPVDLVSTAATAATNIVLPFHRSSTLPSLIPGLKRSSGLSVDIPVTTPGSPQTTPPATPKETLNKSHSSASLNINTAPTPPYTKDVTGQLEFARQELDMLQHYLSLETALQLIHVNKESERRLQQFIDIGFPGRMKSDIQKTYEQVFIHFLKRLGSTHIKPGFQNASERLASYKPNPKNLTEDVPPLTEFFELVHVADLIQQMIQLYYDEEITKNVDKHDFMNDVNKEKKTFERLLDDSVAQSMDQSIQVLLSQVESILANEQLKEDYNPTQEIDEFKTSKACEDTIQCLKTNTSMLVGAAEKTTMDLFFSEIGRRFFEILCKHLKLQTVNELGGIRYICDLNAYYDFILTLRQKTITPYFSALKTMTNIYILKSPADVKAFVHDVELYNGYMRIEDLFEFAACRSDWPNIKRAVQKDMSDCSIM